MGKDNQSGVLTVVIAQQGRLEGKEIDELGDL